VNRAFLLAFCLVAGLADARESVTARQYLVAAAHPLAVDAGLEILAKGGSALDAAIAVQMVLGLVEPESSGIGGGAFLLYWSEKERALRSYDGHHIGTLCILDREPRHPSQDQIAALVDLAAIVEGEIKLKSPATIERVNRRSVTLSDGSELPADLVVLATGYGPMNDWAAQLISPEVAERVGKCWGLGSDTKNDPGPWEGELRNMWKPTQQPGLWFHGGNLMQSRHYSLTLALQLKARMEGLPTPVYGLAPVHHLR